ncbi:MAG: rhomboid family intramembrane serine protease [Thermoanaerobaculia bacterium]|nr:rhomboid family intramembrane serine protease [Thermoanaerobaculia bacterium]
MFRRQTTGSVVCPSCGKLVGVNDEQCWSCGRRRPGMFGFAGVVRAIGSDLGFGQIVIFACGLLYILMLLTDIGGIGAGGLMNLLSPSTASMVRFGASGEIPVLGWGRWWTLLSAGWLHGGLLHIGFNMMWAYQLVPAVARLYGPGRVVIIYVLSSVVGFAASSLAGFLPIRLFFLQPANLTLGASAAILGLLGALVYYGRRTGSSAVHSQALGYAVVLIVFGFVMAGVDNWAHLGGFGGGYLVARWLDPLKPERTDHLMAAAALLGASLLAVLASLFAGLPAV